MSLWVRQIHAVFDKRALCSLHLYALAYVDYYAAETPVEGGKVRLGQDRVGGVVSRSLPHRWTQSSALQQV